MKLTAGKWTLELLPELGGAIGGLSLSGAAVLRPTPPGADEVLQTACFPLIPFTNRIDGARFQFGGRDVQLRAPPGFEPHALHGDGWRRPWTVQASDTHSAVLTLQYPAGDWPWSWSAAQAFDLSEDGLRVTLTLTNTDDCPMPAGMGLHPYFVRKTGTRLRLEAADVWVVDDSMIPVSSGPATVVQDWSNGALVGGAPFVDNAYAGWCGIATVTDDDRIITISASENARWAHVFVPDGETYFCVEPVTHRPNALNAPAGEESGLTVLQPGETLSMHMAITVADQLPGANGNDSPS